MSVSLSTNICLPFSSQTVCQCDCQSQCHYACHCRCHFLFHYQPNHLLVFKLPSSPALSLSVLLILLTFFFIIKKSTFAFRLPSPTTSSLSVLLMLLTFFFIIKKTHLLAFQLPNSFTASFCHVNQLHLQGSRQIARPCFKKVLTTFRK